MAPFLNSSKKKHEFQLRIRDFQRVAPTNYLAIAENCIKMSNIGLRKDGYP